MCVYVEREREREKKFVFVLASKFIHINNNKYWNIFSDICNKIYMQIY